MKRANPYNERLTVPIGHVARRGAVAFFVFSVDKKSTTVHLLSCGILDTEQNDLTLAATRREADIQGETMIWHDAITAITLVLGLVLVLCLSFPSGKAK